MTREDLLAALVEWLDRMRRRHLESARKFEIPPTVAIVETFTTVVNENQTRSRKMQVRVSPMCVPGLRRPIAKDAESRPPDDGALARALHELYGDRCAIHAPFAGVPFATEPAQWIQRVHLAPLADEYVSGLASLARHNVSRARKAAGRLLDLIEGDTVSHVTWIPVGGLAFKARAMACGRVTIRRLTPGELGAMEGDFGWLRVPRRHIGPLVLESTQERHAIEVRTVAVKRADVQPANDGFPQSLLLGLQLMGFEPHGRGESAYWIEPGSPLRVIGGRAFALPERGATRQLTARHLRAAVDLAERVSGDALRTPTSSREVALHRFHMGAAAASKADAIIDFVIALEALLLGADGEGELSYRFRLNGAHFLGRNPAERRTVFNELKQMYNARSQLVHGKKPLTSTELAAHATAARDLAARMLAKALRNGWPTRGELEAHALNASSGG